MPAWLATLIESIAYAIARGAARAWLDVMSAPNTATEEQPNDADRLRAQVFRNAVAAAERMQPSAVGAVPPGPERPTPSSGNSGAQSLGPAS